jgi:hypothetical protein
MIEGFLWGLIVGLLIATIAVNIMHRLDMEAFTRGGRPNRD